MLGKKIPLCLLLCARRISLYKYCFRFIPTVSFCPRDVSLMIASRPSSPLFPLLLHLLSFFSVCMTNSEEIPNCGRPKPAAPPPAFSWQDGSCLTFNHECFARQLGLGEIRRGETEETWAGEPGSVQLNLSTKTPESIRSNTMLIVVQEKKQPRPDWFLVWGGEESTRWEESCRQ